MGSLQLVIRPVMIPTSLLPRKPKDLKKARTGKGEDGQAEDLDEGHDDADMPVI